MDTTGDIIARARELRDVGGELKHYGKKGMKWGVRKDLSGGLRARATLGIRDRRAQKWQITAETKAYGKVYRRSARSIRKGVRELNERPEFKGKSFKVDSPLRRKYYDAYSEMVTGILNKNVSARSYVVPLRQLGRSPNKRLELKFHYNLNREAQPQVTIRRSDTRPGRKAGFINHADEPELNTDPELEVFLVTDENGYILDLDVPFSEEDTMAQGEDFMEDFLEHYGVRGMKWGKRKSANVAPDAAITGALKQQYRKEGLKSLSNDDLQILTKRLELESKVNKWARDNPTKKQQALSFIKKQAGEHVKELVKEELRTGNAVNDQIALFRQATGGKGSKAKARTQQAKTKTQQKPKAEQRPNPTTQPTARQTKVPARVPVHNITSLR